MVAVLLIFVALTTNYSLFCTVVVVEVVVVVVASFISAPSK